MRRRHRWVRQLSGEMAVDGLALFRGRHRGAGRFHKPVRDGGHHVQHRLLVLLEQPRSIERRTHEVLHVRGAAIEQLHGGGVDDTAEETERPYIERLEPRFHRRIREEVRDDGRVTVPGHDPLPGRPAACFRIRHEHDLELREPGTSEPERVYEVGGARVPHSDAPAAQFVEARDARTYVQPFVDGVDSRRDRYERHPLGPVELLVPVVLREHFPSAVEQQLGVLAALGPLQHDLRSIRRGGAAHGVQVRQAVGVPPQHPDQTHGLPPAALLSPACIAASILPSSEACQRSSTHGAEHRDSTAV